VPPITCDAELEEVVGARPATGGLKSIPFLDGHCEAMLAVSPFLVLGTVDADGALRSIALGGDPGTAAPDGKDRLALPHLGPEGLVEGAPAATLALVPGYGETLRVNGRLRLGDVPAIDVEEAFVHCAKAIIRSKLWGDPQGSVAADPPGPTGPRTDLSSPVVRAVLAAAPFVSLASLDDDDLADVSPKGDPSGFVHVLDDRRLAIPDRPGNLRTDTMHNLVSRPDLGLLAFLPGTPVVLEVRGRAEISADPAVREPMAVAGKVPNAAIVLTVDHAEVRHEPALAAARLWDRGRQIERGTLPKASRIWVDHIALHEELGAVDDEQRLKLDADVMHEHIGVNYREGLY
jgi:predicted pyridoxine 5'-phosphate oxidase superfamily flavin-nucleotide-binding protein